MIKEYAKIIIMSVVLVLLLTGIVLMLVMDIDLGIFKSLSLANISDKKVSVDTLTQSELLEKIKHESKLDDLEKEKNAYEVSKEKFDKIDDSTIALVQEATTDEKYFIEYLWIVLGNYARDNDLLINIITPGSSSTSTETTGEDGTTVSKPDIDTTIAQDAIKLIVKGRYVNVADFVYEVENDKELKFKLDNIKMEYTTDNMIQATFTVLSLQVKK